jgi:hypothetical protein
MVSVGGIFRRSLTRTRDFFVFGKSLFQAALLKISLDLGYSTSGFELIRSKKMKFVPKR